MMLVVHPAVRAEWVRSLQGPGRVKLQLFAQSGAMRPYEAARKYLAAFAARPADHGDPKGQIGLRMAG